MCFESGLVVHLFCHSEREARRFLMEGTFEDISNPNAWKLLTRGPPIPHDRNLYPFQTRLLRFCKPLDTVPYAGKTTNELSSSSAALRNLERSSKGRKSIGSILHFVSQVGFADKEPETVRKVRQKGKQQYLFRTLDNQPLSRLPNEEVRIRPNRRLTLDPRERSSDQMRILIESQYLTSSSSKDKEAWASLANIAGSIKRNSEELVVPLRTICDKRRKSFPSKVDKMFGLIGHYNDLGSASSQQSPARRPKKRTSMIVSEKGNIFTYGFPKTRTGTYSGCVSQDRRFDWRNNYKLKASSK